MPLYDFRCAGCGAEREVTVSLNAADGLALVCTACGDTMRRAFSKATGLVLITASPSPSASSGAAVDNSRANGNRSARLRPGSCESRAVRLTRPNPLASGLPGARGGDAA